MQFAKDTYADNDTTYYMVWVKNDAAQTPEDSQASMPRSHLVLEMSVDGINWTYLGDIWRWESKYYSNTADIQHIVDPFITVTEGYLIIGSGISEKVGTQAHHQQREHIWSVQKSTLAPEILGNSISLKGNININYYFDLPYAVLNDANAKVVFTMADGTKVEQAVSEGTKNNAGQYIFSVPVAAKEMTDEIQAEIFYGEGASVQADSYCAKTYADYVIKDETGTYDAVKPLVKAMLHYGAYAQKYFGYNTENLANDGLNIPDLASVTKDTLTGYKAVGAGTVNAKFYGASLLLKSETTLRFFFQVDADATLTVKHEENSLEVKERNGLYYVDVENISAKDLGNVITLEINDGAETASVSASPMTYCYNILAAEEGTYENSIVDLAKALYMYYVQADAYMNTNKEANQ